MCFLPRSGRQRIPIANHAFASRWWCLFRAQRARRKERDERREGFFFGRDTSCFVCPRQHKIEKNAKTFLFPLGRRTKEYTETEVGWSLHPKSISLEVKAKIWGVGEIFLEKRTSRLDGVVGVVACRARFQMRHRGSRFASDLAQGSARGHVTAAPVSPSSHHLTIKFFIFRKIIVAPPTEENGTSDAPRRRMTTS